MITIPFPCSAAATIHVHVKKKHTHTHNVISRLASKKKMSFIGFILVYFSIFATINQTLWKQKQKQTQCLRISTIDSPHHRHYVKQSRSTLSTSIRRTSLVSLSRNKQNLKKQNKNNHTVRKWNRKKLLLFYLLSSVLSSRYIIFPFRFVDSDFEVFVVYLKPFKLWIKSYNFDYSKDISDEFFFLFFDQRFRE